MFFTDTNSIEFTAFVLVFIIGTSDHVIYLVCNFNIINTVQIHISEMFFQGFFEECEFLQKNIILKNSVKTLRVITTPQPSLATIGTISTITMPLAPILGITDILVGSIKYILSVEIKKLFNRLKFLCFFLFFPFSSLYKIERKILLLFEILKL